MHAGVTRLHDMQNLKLIRMGTGGCYLNWEEVDMLNFQVREYLMGACTFQNS